MPSFGGSGPVTTLHGLALAVFRRLPVLLRRWIVRFLTPSYVVGTVVVFRNESGEVLLLRERHHDGWGLPGGLLSRREPPTEGAVREIREEIGVELDPLRLPAPGVVVDPEARRVDVVFCVDSGPTPALTVNEPEVLEARWFAPTALPELFEPSLAVLVAMDVVPRDAVR